MDNQKLIELLKTHKGYDDKQAMKATYQLRIFLHNLLYVFIIGIIFSMMGYLKEYMCIYIFMKFFRAYCGGIHIRSNLLCFITSLLNVIMVLLLEHFVPFTLLTEVILIIYIFAIWYFFVPQSSSQRPIRKENEKQKFKRIVLILILITFCIRFINFSIYTLGLWSETLVLTMTTPLAYKLSKAKHDRM